MKQYQDLLREILAKGTWKEPARKNMPRTLSLFGTKMEFDMTKGFPLVTTKKMYHKGIITELLWFLKGDTNIKYLLENDCNIWNQDAYRWYLKWYGDGVHDVLNESTFDPLTIDEFTQSIKKGYIAVGDSTYMLGDLGKVYGHQWRNQNGVDQVQELIKSIKNDPYSRYHILDAWNKADFDEMALPPCHVLYQFNCRKGPNGEIGLDLQVYQRSCDTFLGVPFNIASAALFLHLIAKITGTTAHRLTWVGGDTHIYENHMPQVRELLLRSPRVLPDLHINKELNTMSDLVRLEPRDIEIKHYISHPKIVAELKTGL